MKEKRFLSDEKQSIESLEQLNDEVQAIEDLLKATNSLRAELLPGSDYDIENKEFIWKLEKIDTEEFYLRLIFENPQYISMDQIDSMKLLFMNTAYYL